ncbi:protein ASPARTIC PROTEASE IN GUARD CELL 1 [Cinnamomum micranthum f. kanehirae]|uniref:Protein ASPARTIC PROTEASE IN GUARD CELL 1 n=1 Tax=Cinnamomum micranthum f. kanehirae TaxID=337451 RepID=A0A3S3MKT6_9MAGN|nr:protein ASPARTIC PROTEASE IN GUARD CELL 1 [Cinnamomum micranthum f. kanehirae]
MASELSSVFLLFLFLSISSITCRVLPTISKTTTLNITASLEKTQYAISFTPQTQQPLQHPHKSSHIPTSTTNPSFTLQLHSRDSLKHPATHKDYKTLTLARLARDSARVKAINAKLAIALSGLDRSDLKPLESDSSLDAKAEDGLQGPIVSGVSQGSGEYFSRVQIGRPPKPLYMVLDTGSDVTWVQCQPCTDCYEQADPVFEPSASSSYAALTCESQPCKSLDVMACRNDTCLYQVSYGDGSYTVGDFVTETLTFGESASVTNIALGCGHDNEGLFVGAAGLLGLGGGSLSFPSQISASAFSYCLVDRDTSASSTLQFGAGNGYGDVTAPLLRNRKIGTFYYLALTGLSVGGEMLSIPPSAFSMDESGSGGVIVDSGTAVTRLQSDAYAALRDAFVKGTKDLPAAAGVALFDTCYDLGSRTSVEVPTVALHFPEGKSLPLPAKNYLIPVDSGRDLLLRVRADDVAVVDHRERAAAGDTCRV